jgi:hypothetical protein
MTHTDHVDHALETTRPELCEHVRSVVDATYGPGTKMTTENLLNDVEGSALTDCPCGGGCQGGCDCGPNCGPDVPSTCGQRPRPACRHETDCEGRCRTRPKYACDCGGNIGDSTTSTLAQAIAGYARKLRRLANA